MLYIETTNIIILAAALMLGARAGGPDLALQLQRDFKMGVFARQNEQGIQEGPSNLNFFTDNLGARGPPITRSNDPKQPYLIDGEKVADFFTAADKACDKQKNLCADQANGPSKDEFKVSDCDQQATRCKSELKAQTQTAFLSKATELENDQFDFFCEN